MGVAWAGGRVYATANGKEVLATYTISCLSRQVMMSEAISQQLPQNKITVLMDCNNLKLLS
jgi:hypothetical protein